VLGSGRYRVGIVSHFLVADVTQKRRLIEEFDDELGVGNDEPAKDQASCFNDSQEHTSNKPEVSVTEQGAVAT
jgi:hypothetical protein